MWEQITINTPTIDSAKFDGIYKDKWDTSYSVKYGEILEMANWITTQLNIWGVAKKAERLG